jgi:hypothetical protein
MHGDLRLRLGEERRREEADDEGHEEPDETAYHGSLLR